MSNVLKISAAGVKKKNFVETSHKSLSFQKRNILWLVRFYDISIVVGGLMSNPVLWYILDMYIWFENTFYRYTVRWSNSSISNYSI